MLYAKQAVLGLALLGGFLAGHPLFAHRNVTSASAPLNQASATAPEAPASGAGLSANWAGYVANNTDTSYTAVGATWTVPAVANDSNNGAASADATWVGVGGVSADDLIQSGTQAVVQDGQVEYQAWVETLPNVLQPISLSVHAGDSVSVSLAEQQPGHWGLSFHNNTTGTDYHTTIAYNSSDSSAEWIEEMPVGGSGRALNYLPLDNFGSVSFSNAYTIANGSPQSLSGSGAQALNMAAGGHTLLASASAVDSTGSGFSVVRTSASAAQVATASVGGHWRRSGSGMHRSTAPAASAPGTSLPAAILSTGDGWIQILFQQ